MKRIVQKIGDVYSVALNNSEKKYFQYISDDITMLNCRVVRTFKKRYPIDDNPELSDIINDAVDFYVHVIIKWGYQMNLWEKIGNIKDVGEVKPTFRTSVDYGMKLGEQMKKVSENWRVWKMNEPMKFVGKLEGENKKAELGIVIDPISVVERMQTGKYNISYPGFDLNSVLEYDPSKESDLRKEYMKRVYHR